MATTTAASAVERSHRDRSVELTPGRPEQRRRDQVIALTPPRTIRTVSPTSREQIGVTVTNRTPLDRMFYLSVVSLRASRRPTSTVEPLRRGRPDRSWIRPAVNSLQIPAGDSARIPVSIDVPAGADPGVHSLAVLVSHRVTTLGSGNDGRSRVTVEAGIASQIFLIVPGDARVDARLVPKRSPRFVQSGRPATFTADLVNRGNTLVQASGTFETGGWAGRASHRTRVREVLVLPDGRRRVTARWNRPPMLGWYRPELTLSAAGGRPLKARFPTVIAVPPWWVGVAVTVSILAAYVGYRRRRISSRRP